MNSTKIIEIYSRSATDTEWRLKGEFGTLTIPKERNGSLSLKAITNPSGAPTKYRFEMNILFPGVEGGSQESLEQVRTEFIFASSINRIGHSVDQKLVTYDYYGDDNTLKVKSIYPCKVAYQLVYKNGDIVIFHGPTRYIEIVE